MKIKSYVWNHMATSNYVDFFIQPVAAILKICKLRKCHGLNISTAGWYNEFMYMAAQIYEKKMLFIDS